MEIKVSQIENNTGQIKGVPENPRSISKTEYEQIRHELSEHPESLQEEPLLLYDNEGHYVALGGNQRLRAIRDLGWKEIEHVGRIIPNGTPVKELQKRIIRHNLHAGEWDDDLLANQWDEADLEEWGYDMPDDWGARDLPENVDDVPALPTKPYSKQGDLWLLGNHRVLCGDSTDKETVERLMDGKKADMVFTDPPYSVSYAAKNDFLNGLDKGNRNQKEIENDHLSTEETMETVWKPAFALMLEACKDSASYYMTAPQGGDQMMMMMSLVAAGWQVKHELIWLKNNHVLGRSDYNYKHEPILYGWKLKGKHNFYGDGTDKSVWEIDKPSSSKEHPTMKPVELMVKAITNSSKSGQTILDVFLGSGSTLMACEQTDRICYGLELDPQYVDVICKRYQQHTGEMPILERTGEPHDFQ